MNHFQEIKEPLCEDCILIYADLRKFSFIEENYQAKEIYEMLNEMHGIISQIAESAGGVNIRWIADNTMILYKAENFDGIYQNMLRIKVEVDQYFKEKKLPNVIHINAHTAKGNIGLLGKKQELDVSGAVLNEIGFQIVSIDTSNNKDLFNGLVVSENFYQNLSECFQEDFQLVSVNTLNLFVNEFI